MQQKISKNRQKKQGGKQKTQWEQWEERWGWGIFTTERKRVVGGWVSVLGGVHLHRSTGLRSWTARDRRGPVTPAAVFGWESPSRHRGLTGKTNRKRNDTWSITRGKGEGSKIWRWEGLQVAETRQGGASVGLTLSLPGNRFEVKLQSGLDWSSGMKKKNKKWLR